jgi:hypothetical protein
MTITLPDEMRAELEAEAKAGGFATVDEYVHIMYQRAKYLFGVNGENWWGDESDADPDGPVMQRPGVRERLIALAEEGLRSPPIADPHGFLDGLVREASRSSESERP